MNKRRDLRNEADHLPTDLDDLDRLRSRLLEAGHPEQVAAGVCSFVLVKAFNRKDDLSSATRSRYRRILAELPPLEPAGPKSKKRHLAAVVAKEAGLASAPSAVGIGAGATAAAVAVAVAGPVGALVGPPVALYVTMNPGDDGSVTPLRPHFELVAVEEIDRAA